VQRSRMIQDHAQMLRAEARRQWRWLRRPPLITGVRKRCTRCHRQRKQRALPLRRTKNARHVGCSRKQGAELPRSARYRVRLRWIRFSII
jgi:hypothetical protein